MSNTRKPAAKQLQAARRASFTSSTLQYEHEYPKGIAVGRIGAPATMVEQFAGSATSSMSFDTTAGRAGSPTSISRGNPLADFPCVQPAACAPVLSVRSTYGLLA